MIALLAAAMIAGAAPSADAKNEVLAVVDALLTTLWTGDADAFDALVAENAMTVSIDGTGVRRSFPVSVFSDDMRSGDHDPFKERYWSPSVHIRGGLAVVWAPYVLDAADGRRIHCGVDVFNMSRHDDSWKVDSLNFTMEPDGCDELDPPANADMRPRFADED